MRAAFLGALLAACAQSALAANITEAQARRFVAEQEAAWNSGAFPAYFRRFTPDAVFVDQHRTPKETITYGRSTVAEARKLTLKSAGRSVERGTIRSLVLAPDGASVRIVGTEVMVIENAGVKRTVCAERDQTLVLSGGQLRSKGQTDTITNCRPATPERR